MASKEPADKLRIPMMLDAAEAVALSAMVCEEGSGTHCWLDFPIQYPD